MDKTERHNQSVSFWNKLLELDAVTNCLTNDDLCQIILKTDEQTRKAAWHMLFHGNRPLRQHLLFIIRHIPALRDEAWKKLREWATTDELYIIMRDVESLRDEAWKTSGYASGNDTMRRIIRNIPSLRLAAARRLLDNNPTLRDLYFIRNEVTELRKEVEKKLEEPKYKLLQQLFDLYHG